MSNQVDTGRRQFLTVATIATGAVGAAFAAVPFLASWKPSARAKALGAPVEVDISKVDPGAMIKVEWRGKAVYIVHRTPQMLTQLEGMAPKLRDPDSKQSEQPDFARNPARALKPEYLVLVGVCTHLGCAPLDRFTPGDVTVSSDWPGGFFCPCHGSKFDLSGRVFKDVPAPTNLSVPPYRFLSDSRLLIGAETGNA
ncbi:MAG TPA: ubiquinol-cytochrome c reductase iron-sulfur subunit [Steroidobacteraceae bacterium]|jgi:ubiquinol-cytochrome c reductase iron-sulfur subunit|nr:ubiquinol-cytochrome c reductase iron-sulfur subunit [Steroidobacteraceae bacterium]